MEVHSLGKKNNISEAGDFEISAFHIFKALELARLPEWAARGWEELHFNIGV